MHEGVEEQGWLWYTTFDGNTWSKDTQLTVSGGGGCGTSGPPALIANGNQFFAVHEGREDDGWIWSFNNTENVDRKLTAGGSERNIGTTGTPGLALYNDTFYLLHQGQGESGWLWMTTTTALPPSFSPNWIEDRGENGYCFYSLGTGGWDRPKERVVTISKTITVDPGVPFLIANLSDSWQTTEFPAGAMLTIQAPDGTIYDQEEFGTNVVIKSGTSLQSLMIKEPMAGDYHVSLTASPQKDFHFVFQTLPSEDLMDTIVGSEGLQKRGLGRKPQVASSLAALWILLAGRGHSNLPSLEEILGYTTGSQLDVSNTTTPANVPDGTDLIVNFFTIPSIDNFTTPPSNPTPAPIPGPVIEYVRNSNGALLWLRARITRNHLNTGTGTTDRTRAFAQNLGIPTDQAGHVIASRLGGLGSEDWNIFPQNPNFNMGTYRAQIEAPLYDAVNRYGDAEVWFRFHYDDPQHPDRPTSFDYCWRLGDGTVAISDLYNPENVPRGL